MDKTEAGRIIIALHGVGDTKKGEVAKGLAEGLGIPNASMDTLLVDGNDYQRLLTDDGKLEIVEVNWSDILKPDKGWWSILKQAGLIITSMLSLAEQRWQMRFRAKLNVFRLLRFCLEALTPGAVFFSLSTVLGMVVKKPGFVVGLLLLVIAFFAWFTYKATAYSKNYRWGWVWLAPLTAYLASVWTNKYTGQLQELSMEIREYGQVITSGLAFAVFLGYLYLYVRKKDKDCIATEFSFTYLPFLAFNSAATMIAFLSLRALKEFGDENMLLAWDKAAKNFLRFDLAKAELMTTIIYSIIGIIPLIYTVLYMKKSGYSGGIKEAGLINKKGRLLQQALALLLRVSPLLLLFLTGYLTYLVITWNKDVSHIEPIWHIYEISILRTIPFFSWFVGPLAIVTGVVGDILFYIQPDENARHGTREKCLYRLKCAMEYAHSKPGAEKTVVAHSWGTVVAVDYLCKYPTPVRLVTLGSPLEALCYQFLGMEVMNPALLSGWLNAYRYGDYIAGPLAPSSKAINELIGDGGHMDYWKDKTMGEAILPDE